MDGYLYALLGGALIGLASGLFLVLTGRIAGISGVLGGALIPRAGDWMWRGVFVLGLATGGILLVQFLPEVVPTSYGTSKGLLIAAGLLVGFGTRLGSGCTSGHGVCGVSRFSPRSLVATGTFITAGVLTVLVAKVFA